MDEQTIIYDEFINSMINAEINFNKDSFRAILVSDGYIPSKSHTYQDKKGPIPFEIHGINYIKGGSLVEFAKGDEVTDLKIKEGHVKFENISPLDTDTNRIIPIRYMVIYKDDSKKILLMCQDFGQNLLLENDDLILTWDDFCIQIIPENKKVNDNYNSILSKAIVGKIILGRNI